MEEERKIYIGNLDYGVTEDDLKQVLEGKGLQAKDLKIITDRLTGRSKGFGFAEFENEDDAKKAVSSLDGFDFKGRKLRVNQARKQRPRFERNDNYSRFRK